MSCELVRVAYDKPWIPYKNKVEFYISSTRNEFEFPVTTVHGFFFNREKQILLVEHVKRGWEVPGGHIEPDESYSTAMHRELHEEAQMAVSGLSQLGYLRKIALEEKPEKCDYPFPESFCIFYGGMINRVHTFTGDSNIINAKFFEVEEALKVPWITAYIEYFNKARELFS